MSDDPLPYGLYYLDALRGIMRRALDVVAEQGLPDNHYFHITFRTDHPDVVMPKVLRLQYPTEMAIILQHVFQDLQVNDHDFSVTLSFNRVQQRLTVPLEAVTMFQDPPANVVLTFAEAEQAIAGEAVTDADGSEEGAAEAGPDEDGSDSGVESRTEKRGNVIAFDNFRKS
ncbi:MAG: hypothetical protein JSU82_07285 [Rhodospirillales bacterium]|nr:MAG: hypothetical protein JSU82_07285 [Rhodospirillales bacterium]